MSCLKVKNKLTPSYINNCVAKDTVYSYNARLKMLWLYLLGQNGYFYCTFKSYLSSVTYSSKYKKLPNMKQLNSLTTIVTFSWLGNTDVTHPLWLPELPGSIPSLRQGFLCLIFVVVVVLLFLSKTQTSFCL